MPVAVTGSGVHLVSQADCGDGQICYSVSVDCNGLLPREAEIRVNHLDKSKGAVVFTIGGVGTGFYADHSGSPGDTVNRMRDEGYETYEVSWTGERGWSTDGFGQGLKKVMCAYAELVQWIATNIADNPEVMGATGNSMQIGYGLALYGLEDVLDVVVMSGGPPTADAVDACYRTERRDESPVLMDYLLGWQDEGDYCLHGEGPEWTIAALEAESIVSALPGELRDYDYPNTKVAFVEGEGDVDNIRRARKYYDAITSEKSWVVLPGVGHGVHRDPDGAATVFRALAALIRRQNSQLYGEFFGA